MKLVIEIPDATADRVLDAVAGLHEIPTGEDGDARFARGQWLRTKVREWLLGEVRRWEAEVYRDKKIAILNYVPDVPANLVE